MKRKTGYTDVCGLDLYLRDRVEDSRGRQYDVCLVRDRIHLMPYPALDPSEALLLKAIALNCRVDCIRKVQ